MLWVDSKGSLMPWGGTEGFPMPWGGNKGSQPNLVAARGTDAMGWHQEVINAMG